MKINLYTRPRNNSWQYVISYKPADKWKTISKQGYKTKADAKADGLLKVQDLLEFAPPDVVMTFKQCADLMHLDGRKSTNTIKAYNSWLKAYESIWGLPVANLGYKELAPIIKEYSLKHKHSSAKSVRDYGSRVFHFSQKKLKQIRENPFDQIQVIAPRQSDKKEKKALTIVEINDLIVKAPRDLKLIIAIMGLCGLRLGEARGIKAEDIDLKNNLLHVRRQRYESGDIGPIKNGVTRSVPLPKVVKEIYLQSPVIHGFVCGLHHSDDLSAVYRSVGFKITSHELRHSFATNCIQRGMDFKTTAMMIGDTVEMVLKTYSHVNTDMMDNAKRIIENF